jgi:hypothetical protein
MSRFENACPFDARTRANRCENCVSANNSVPPCVAAYLGGPDAARARVISIQSIEVVRKAA